MSKRNNGKNKPLPSNSQSLRPQNHEEVSGSPNDFDELKAGLHAVVPSDLKLEVQRTPSQEEVKTIIEDANARAAVILDNAKIAIIKSYTTNERERSNRQKPLLWLVVGLTGLQLIAFNVIIGVMIHKIFTTGKPEVILPFFEILKYYIGATVVELIGMILFITRDTFSSNHFKMMQMMLKDESLKQDANRDINKE